MTPDRPPFHECSHVSRRQLLAQGRGFLLAAAAPTALIVLMDEAAAQAGEQPDWRFCNRCNQMFFDGYANNKGRCPAGGGHTAVGYHFRLRYDPAKARADRWQYDWRFCNKCSTIFYDGYPNNKGRCPAGGGHAAAGYMFGLYYTNEKQRAVPSGPHQAAWRFCGKCNSLFFDGNAQKGSCPAGGGHAAAGWTFHLPYRDLGQSAAGLGSIQNVVATVLEATFNARREQLTNLIKQELGRGDMISKGVTLYEINLRLGGADFKFTAPTAFTFRVNGNHLYFRSTQPTAAGKWADPAFEVNWDMVLNGVLVPPKGPTKPTIQSLIVTIPRAEAKSRNVSGGVILGIANLVINAMQQSQKGRETIRAALDRALRHDITSQVNAALAKM